VWGVRFSPDGRTLAVSCGKQVHLWDVATRTRRVEPVTIDNKYGDATFAFCPSAPAFVALNKQRVLTLYSSETGDAIRSLDFALGRNVTCVCFAPDGLTCAVGGSNKQFAVFDVDL
jgi:WD40 repeat protein